MNEANPHSGERLSKGRSVLAPLSRLYGAGIFVRNRLYDRGILRALHSPIPVICVGNAVAGGSGKSPLADYLAAKLLRLGAAPAVVLRGYGGRLGGPHEVSQQDSPEDVGDEALMHLQAHNGKIKVIISRDRYAGACTAGRAGCNVAVLDDGLQHRALSPDLSLLLLDCSSPESVHSWQSGELLPLGKLREPLTEAAARSSAIVTVTRGRPAGNQPVPCELSAGRPIIPVALAPDCFLDLFSGRKYDLAWAAGRKANAAAGIASPGGFFSMLQGLGLQMDSTHSFADHYNYSDGDWRRLRASSVAPLVVTLKDAVKLKRFVQHEGELFVLLLSVCFAYPDAERLLWQEINKVVPGLAQPGEHL